MSERDCLIRWARQGAPAMLALFFAVPAWADTHTVKVVEYRFEPSSLRIKTGDTVRWLNAEKRTSHSVRFPGLGGLESDRFFPDETWSMRFEQPGRHDYHCGPHPEMKGQIVVED